MANSITLTSDSYLGREFIFTVTQYGTSTTVNWTFEVTKMNPGNGTRADVSDINCTINGYSVYSYPATGWSQSTKFPVYYGSISGSYDIGSYGTFSVVLSGRPGYSSPTSKSGTITLTQPAPPTPTVNTISVQPIPDFIAGYDGDIFTLTCNPSGGTGYTYKWYKYADYYGDSVIIGESQTLTGTLYNDNWDNNYIYCVVTDSTGGTATTNRCQLRIGTADSQTQVSTKQVEPVRVYNGSSFIYVVPFIYNEKWLYVGWKIIEITPLPLWADTRLNLVDSVSGMAHPVVDTSAHHNILLTMYFPKAQILSVSHSAAEQTLSMTMFIPEAQGVTVHPLMAEQAISLTMTIPFVRSVVLNPFTMNQDFDMTMHIPSARGVVLNPLTLTQAASLTMTIPRGQGVELHSVTAQQAMIAHLSSADVVDITISPGQVSQVEPLTMRASGVPVQVMSDAVDHVLPSMVGDISPEVLTAQDRAASERMALSMSVEAKAIYPRFVQRDDIVYIYRPMRWRQDGNTVYLDYIEN